MSEIRVKDNESLDSALRRWKKSCARSGVLAEVRKREHYEKPSVRRKKKSEAARKRKYKYAWLSKAGCEKQPAFCLLSQKGIVRFIHHFPLPVIRGNDMLISSEVMIHPAGITRKMIFYGTSDATGV